MSCGKPVEPNNDLAQLLNLTPHFENIRKANYEPGTSQHILPVGECPGTPWVAQYLTDQPLAEGEKYDSYLESILRLGYQRLTGQMFLCHPPETTITIPICDAFPLQVRHLDLVVEILDLASVVIKFNQEGVLHLEKSVVKDGILYVPFLNKYYVLDPETFAIFVSDSVGGATLSYEGQVSNLEELKTALEDWIANS